MLLYGQYVLTVLPYFLPKIPARELLVHDDGAVMVAPPSELIAVSNDSLLSALLGLNSLAAYLFRHEIWHFILTPTFGIIFILKS